MKLLFLFSVLCALSRVRPLQIGDYENFDRSTHGLSSISAEKLEIAERKIINLQKSQAQKDQEIERLETELNEANRRISDFQKRLSESNLNLVTCEQQGVSTRNADLMRMDDKLTAMTQQKNNLVLVNENLASQNRLTESLRSKLSADLAKLQTELEECKKNPSISNQNSQLSDEYISVRTSFENLISIEFEKFGPIASAGKQKSFFISRSKHLSWDQAKEFCQNLGMNLASFNSYNEGLYFDGASKYNAWLGIRDKYKNGQFLRITDDKNVKDDVPWRVLQPSGNEFCTHSWDGFAFNDLSCSAHLRFACELYDPQTQEELGQKIKLLKIAKEKALLEGFNRHETTSNGRKKILYISKQAFKLNWSAAFKFCADIKMNLATFNSKQEAEFIDNIGTHNIWVGVRDNMRNGKFLRVTDGVDVTSYVPWRPGQPSGYEFCVHLWDGNKYNDISCNLKLPFACETYDSLY